ncbi:hypothetical protein [Agrococcus sp. ARC_14]|uniref:hypothetical protein n=1 Tax=Agrococcus sp. ARC_14 TaxID=2919927 RepID=UPI001F0544D9|nr:hypothetical protein [Agrococcus sp. ARC_14]MCH1882225.1 hypothetical protein [Agrococcus sp. ARC_14]
MKKQLLAATAVAGLAIVGLAAPAQAAPPPGAAMNHTDYWEAQGYGDCDKIDLPDGVGSYTLPELPWGLQYTLLVLKAGSGSSANDVIAWPVEGSTYEHATGKDLSHIIVCTTEMIS